MALCRFAQSHGPSINLKIGEDIPDVAALIRVVCSLHMFLCSRAMLGFTGQARVSEEGTQWAAAVSTRQNRYAYDAAVFRARNCLMYLTSKSTMENRMKIPC